MISLLIFLAILSLLIFIHELGHFVAARKQGIKVEEFGFGYPPRLWGKKFKGTLYSLNLLPFGGFVRMRGEDEAAGRESFYIQPKLSRFIVLVAGVVMNFLLGVFLFAAVYTKMGIPEPVDYLTVTHVAPGSPAEAAGIKVKDKIVDYSETQAFIRFIEDHLGESVNLTVVDSGESRIVALTPRIKAETPEGQGALGVGITNIDLVQYPLWQRPARGAWYGLKEAVAWGNEIVLSLKNLLGRLFAGQVPEDVSGPVGIYQASKNAGDQGWQALLQFTGILSVNLAILNLLPLPALDGGRILFIVIEVFRRRRVQPAWEQKIHLAGMLLLIGLMVLVTVNDIRRLVAQ